MKLLSIISLFFLSCADWDGRLILINKTNQTIRYHYELMNINDSIPDLSYCERTNLYNARENREVQLMTQNKWDLYLKGQLDKVLRIYIINEDSLSKYGTCEVFKQQIFMKRFVFTYDDLEKIKWRVVYDGNINNRKNL